MGRRIPKEEPHLRWTDDQLQSDPRVRRRRGVVPHQSTLSVQNVPDASTKEGTAMINEEFRRLRLAIEGLQAAKEQTPAVADTSTDVEPTKQIPPAQTYTHNEDLVEGSQVQVVNFNDSDSIEFYLEKDVVSNKWKKYTSDQTLGDYDDEVDHPQKVNISAKVRFKGVTGTVYVNQLPVEEPAVWSSEDEYKYFPKNYDPDHGKYGWYVYQTIQHNLGLSDKNSYIMELIDLHQIDNRDDLAPIGYAGRFETQQGLLEHEGLDRNKLIIRAVIKPDLHYYFGTMLPQSLEYIDEPNGIVRTNLVFRYTIIKVK